MNLYFLLLVNWGMGAAIIGIFAVVCIVMVAIVMHLVKGGKNGRQAEE